MRVINPNANVGKLIAFTVNGKPEKLDVKIIRFLQPAIFVIYAGKFKIEVNLLEKTGFITAENFQIEVQEINYKIFRDSESTIFKVEWKIPSDEINVNPGNYYSLTILESSDDLDCILKVSKLEIQELN